MRISAREILAVIESIEGAADARMEQVTDLPVLSVKPKRMALARYGLDVSALPRLRPPDISLVNYLCTVVKFSKLPYQFRIQWLHWAILSSITKKHETTGVNVE